MRLSIAGSSMRSGCSCASIHLSTPIARTFAASPGPRAEGQAIEHLLNLLVGKQLGDCCAARLPARGFRPLSVRSGNGGGDREEGKLAHDHELVIGDGRRDRATAR